MPREQQRLKLADYVVLAINPGLIMVLVGTLVFFLAEILYAGNYSERLRFVLFWGVAGIVGVSRIALNEESSDRSGMYGLVLGLAVYVALLRFVEYPPGPAKDWGWLINIFLLAVVWWTSHCLTRDCTHLEDDEEIGNEGVLAAAGVGGAEAADAAAGQDAAGPPTGPKQGWLERYQCYRQEQRSKRTPGVWVVYYSLGALPLFGLGQTLIPPGEDARRRYTFLLLCLYVASGLGLLLTTTFLGLRRYLRQRGTRMPAVMTGAWLTTGLVLIVLFLVVAAVVPRPAMEYSWSSMSTATGPERAANKLGVWHDSAGKGRGRSGADGDKNDAGGPGQGGKTKDGGANSSGKDGGASGKDGSGKDGQGKGGKSQGGNSKDGQGQGQQRSDKQPSGGNDDRKRKEDDKKGSGGRGSAKDSGAGKKNSAASSQSSQAAPRLPNLEGWQGLATLLKWLVFALLVIAVLAMVAYKGLRFLANFTAWAQRLLAAWHDFWARLFARGGAPASGAAGEPAPKTLPPFAAFSDPFVDGRAERLSPRQMIQYSFQALESWAAERQWTRADGETPLEFAARVAGEAPVIEDEILDVGRLFTFAAYGPGILPEGCVSSLREFWAALTRASERATLV